MNIGGDKNAVEWITADQPVLLGGAIEPVTEAAYMPSCKSPKCLKKL